ncbi:MAG: hypothetical protein IJM14_08250 [Lachnospiraceae bacterium]|nr:hypothetical protein [Lachnospiraceae bacterium]
MRETRLLLTLLRKGQSFEIKKEDRKSFWVIGIIIMLFVIIPVCAAAGFLTYAMTLAFIERGGQTEGILFVILFLSAFAFVFAFSVVMNEFYFSSDLDFLLPLPVKTRSLIAAKFINTYIAETGMELLVILSAFIGYIFAIDISFTEIVKILISLVLMPVVPLVYCGIISMLMMRFLSLVRSRNAMRVFTTAISVILAVFAVYSFGGLRGLSIESFIDTLINDENRFVRIMEYVFLPCSLLVKAKGLSGILYGTVLILALAALFIVMAGALYEKGLNNYRSTGAKMRENKAQAPEKKMSPSVSLFRKELRILTRTSGFVSNCLVINIFWPVLAFIVMLMLKDNNTIVRFTYFYRKGYYMAHLTVILIMLGLAAITAAGSALGSSAITREGAHAGFMKYIPVPMEAQLRVKAVVSVIFCGLSYAFDVIIMGRSFSLDVKDMLYYLVLGILMIIFITFLGIRGDARHPKLVWEDEVNALRANLNVFLNMAEAILLIILFSGLAVVLYNIKPMTITGIRVCYMLIMIALSAYAVIFYKKTAVREMEKLEI